MHASGKNISNKGFSLVELSIVIVIVGIMLAGALKMGGAAINSGKITDTNKKLAVIQSALQLYLETNGTLPCPAPGTVATSGSTFGSSLSTGTACSSHTLAGAANTVYIGAVPTRTLNLPDSYAFDGWGNKISYVVDIDCISTTNPWKTSFDATGFQCYNGAGGATVANITVKDTSVTGNTMTASAAYILISHGKNGVGGWNKTTSRISTPCPSSAYDLDNASYPALCESATAPNKTAAINGQFRDGNINDGNVAANYFDDIVRWQTDDMMNFCRYNSTDC